MSAIERNLRGRQHAFFQDPATDKLLAALLNLLAEHWALKQRVLTLEKVLESIGVIDDTSLKRVKLSDDDKAEFESMRQKLLQDVFRSLEQDYGETEPPV